MIDSDLAERPILLVDDNPDDVELTVYALAEDGVSNPVVVAKNGAEAHAQLFGCAGAASPPRLPAFVLLDLKLPRISGLELLRAIRAHERTALLVVIVLSSSREERDLRDSYRLGANSYIRKPVDFDAFRSAAQVLSTYWLRLNEPPPTGSRP